jgi:hypothetical protein
MDCIHPEGSTAMGSSSIACSKFKDEGMHAVKVKKATEKKVK